MTEKDKIQEERVEQDIKDTEAVETDEKTEPETSVEDKREVELENRYLRLMAEYDNFRKRSQKEKSKMYDDACIDVIQKILPLIDSLERSVELAASVTGEAKAFADGIPLMAEQALAILNGIKVERIDALNQPFDAELHHALQQVEKDGVDANTVIDVVQTGYRLDDRLIRPALVIVSV